MTTTTSIKLEDGLRDRLRELARGKNRTAHGLMKDAIEQYVTREEKQQAFRHAAEEAWQEYEATGVHATQQEMVDLFRRLTRPAS